MRNKTYQGVLGGISPSIAQEDQDGQKRWVGGYNVNDPINQAYSSGMTESQIIVVNGFFREYLCPEIEGICKKCFKLTLPRSGWGARWYSEETMKAEIRLSGPKQYGQPGQKLLYLTHRFIKGTQILHVKYDGITRQPELQWNNLRTLPNITSNLKQEATHIPWELYNYADTVNDLSKIMNQKLPLCQCRKKRR